jgi:hypothetical protein
LFLIGCAAFGPTDAPDFELQVSSQIPKEFGTPQITGPAEWISNTRGFNDVRNILISTPPKVVPGVLIITGNGFLFMQWSQSLNRYEIVKGVVCSAVKEVTLDRFGRNLRLVITLNDFSNESFGYHQPGNVVIDLEKTEKAVVSLKANCKLP